MPLTCVQEDCDEGKEVAQQQLYSTLGVPGAMPYTPTTMPLSCMIKERRACVQVRNDATPYTNPKPSNPPRPSLPRPASPLPLTRPPSLHCPSLPFPTHQALPNPPPVTAPPTHQARPNSTTLTNPLHSSGLSGHSTCHCPSLPLPSDSPGPTIPPSPARCSASQGTPSANTRPPAAAGGKRDRKCDKG